MKVKAKRVKIAFKTKGGKKVYFSAKRTTKAR